MCECVCAKWNVNKNECQFGTSHNPFENSLWSHLRINKCAVISTFVAWTTSKTKAKIKYMQTIVLFRRFYFWPFCYKQFEKKANAKKEKKNRPYSIYFFVCFSTFWFSIVRESANRRREQTRAHKNGNAHTNETQTKQYSRSNECILLVTRFVQLKTFASAFWCDVRLLLLTAIFVIFPFTWLVFAFVKMKRFVADLFFFFHLLRCAPVSLLEMGMVYKSVWIMSLQKYFGQTFQLLLAVWIFFLFFMFKQPSLINKLTWLKCLLFRMATPKIFKNRPGFNAF